MTESNTPRKESSSWMFWSFEEVPCDDSLVSLSFCGNSMLSTNGPLKLRNCPDWILLIALHRIGGRADNSTAGRTLRGVAVEKRWEGFLRQGIGESVL